MTRLQKATLDPLRDQLASHRWRDAELDELAAPKLGIITGFQDLLDDLEDLRRKDLGFTAPVSGPPQRRKRR